MCASCYKFCKTCSEASNSKACLSCIDGYTLSNSECVTTINMNPSMK